MRLSWLKQIALSLVIVAVAVGWVWHDARQTTGSADGAPGAPGGFGARGGSAALVVTATAEMTSLVDVLRVIGNGEAVREVSIYPHDGGEVTDVNFQSGARVDAGDVLITLESDEERLQVELAEVMLAEAQRVVDRYAQLAPSGAVSTAQLETARSDLRLAETELRAAELDLARREVRAPFDGVVGLPEIDTGDRITTSTLITTLADRSSLTVEFEVPERFAAHLEEGMVLQASTPALPGRTLDGMIAQIDSRLDATTRTLRVWAEIPNSEDRLRPGMSFTVVLSIPQGDGVSVPEIAVQWDRSGSYVWRIADGTAARVPVTILSRQQGRIVLSGDLGDGALVAVEGLHNLRPGREVEIANLAAPSAGEDAATTRPGS